MDERIKNHLIQHNKAEGYTDESLGMLREVLEAAKRVHREEIEQHRWWNIYQYVVEIDEMFISYAMAEANRDESVDELGWEFDWASVCEVTPKEKSVLVYEPITIKDTPCDPTP